jgi:hypothetical protein
MSQSLACGLQTVRSDSETEAVLREWACGAAAQDCSDVVETIQESGAFAALAEIQDCIAVLLPKYAPCWTAFRVLPIVVLLSHAQGKKCDNTP